MNQVWTLVIQFLFLCLMLGVATIIKLNAKFLQKHLIPTAMIAGFLGLAINIIGEYVFDYVILDRKFLSELVYHLMGVGFIAMALKDRKNKKSKAILNTGFAIINTYAWQAIIGFGVSLLLAYTIFPDLFPATGMILPLSFAQGHGQANNIGSTWEAIGFTNGGNVGLSMATFGYLWAFLGGIPLINYLSRKRRQTQNDFDGREVEVSSVDMEKNIQHSSTVPKSIYVDDATLQIILIGCVYALTYGVLMLLDYLVTPLGSFAKTLTDLFWGFNFLFGTLLALLVKKIMNKLKYKGILKINYVDNYILQKISAGSFDIMITAGIAAVSISVVYEYLWPLLIITTVGGVFTMFYTTYIAKKIYDKDILENIAGLYGMWTGTITTGVALLREVDPYAKTDVTDNMVLGSGVAAGLAVPLLFILNVPITGYIEGKSWMYGLTFVLLLIYSAFMILFIYLNNKKYRKK